MVKERKTKEITDVALSAVFITVCAWIAIPTVVPFTLQTFGIFLALGLFGGKRGTMAVLVYLLIGAVGAPVFAGFQGGLGALTGVTGGYLLGFLMIGLIYWLITHFAGEKMMASGLAMLAGLLVCYAFGTIWFMAVYAKNTGTIGIWSVLLKCVIPFLIPDLVKLGLALALSIRLRRVLRMR